MGGCTTAFIATIVILIFAIAAMWLSMITLEPLEYGIEYNKITKTVYNTTYRSGRYFLWPWNTFIIYPAHLITVEFSDNRRAKAPGLQTRTAEGLNLLLHVSFQYNVQPDGLTKLYNLANVNYHGTIVRIARDAILKVAGSYNANSYWTERKKIGDMMRDQLNKDLQAAYCNCVALQVLRVDLPNIYEDSIVETQVEVQKANMRKFQQQAELIRQNISVIRSEAEQQINIINSSGEAEGYRITQAAKAQAINNTITAENAVYSNVRTRLGFLPNEFSEYLFLNSLQDKKDVKLLVGLQNSIINFGNTPVQTPTPVPAPNPNPVNYPIA